MIGALGRALAVVAIASVARTSRADEPAPPPPPPAPAPFPSPARAPVPPPPPPAGERPTDRPLDKPVQHDAWDAPPPAGARAEREPRGGFTGASIALFSVSYGTALTAALVCNVRVCGATDKEDTLVVPFFGPFVQMAVTQSPGGNVLLAADGLAQGAAVMLFVAARLWPADAAPPPTVSLVPVVGAGRAGVAVGGAF